LCGITTNILCALMRFTQNTKASSLIFPARIPKPKPCPANQPGCCMSARGLARAEFLLLLAGCRCACPQRMSLASALAAGTACTGDGAACLLQAPGAKRRRLCAQPSAATSLTRVPCAESHLLDESPLQSCSPLLASILGSTSRGADRPAHAQSRGPAPLLPTRRRTETKQRKIGAHKIQENKTRIESNRNTPRTQGGKGLLFHRNRSTNLQQFMDNPKPRESRERRKKINRRGRRGATGS